ncbi:aminomethyl-transferring glycine dehydrogenase [Paracoccus fistulariae]|uniref:Glycine dehydrogenase (decarboxylating) n=1 Tax=Paracoccus fistulariae TaxID=658446 RepID=A0ABY7SHL3_9RHOB|nr:aminomethyl-transferring glycine dehydrogenase [Paracoccus fistulariae]MDB6181039.1 aminomethyl-transferring glycine dehydrogenase [Paracoccus fistulariae]WCR06334.1 aminomethyl-transferring glycine dehydrogenase [Paracoccus fistulariae]
MTRWNPTDYNPDDFANRRHIGPSPAEMSEMLQAVGADSLDALIEQTVPRAIRQDKPLDWPALSEAALLARMEEVAKKNKVMTSLIGQGYYGTVTPPAIQRNIFENPAWYTAYTPYQPEIAQGRLEALLNYQTMVADLTALPVANASLLDEATAAAEAMAMARRQAKSKADAFFVAHDLHPQTISVIETRAAPLGIRIITGSIDDLNPEEVFGAIFQYPGTYGHIRDLTPEIKALHAAKALAVVATDLLALCLLKAPGEMGADIAVGSAQRFGVPMGYGGPHAAFMSCRDELKRAMPGRIVGVSVDAKGNQAYRLSLQTREQHIRREKATSNVCTAQALLAVMASFYAVFHGPMGLRAIAQRVHLNAVTLANALRAAGADVAPDQFFDTITVKVGVGQAGILAAAEQRGINLRKVGRDRVGISVDETTDAAVITRLLDAFGITDPAPRADAPAIPEDLLRDSDYLTHPVFHMNRAESEMMRYMRRLSDRDLALDRAMIPLGSCTMKLNAAAEMMPITWPEFGALHPFAPRHQAAGYAEAIADLDQKLCEITGYDAFSMQPNSGAQGEYAGLLTIQAYHRANGDDQRDVCLVPSSAHGTNPASAQMCGMKVVVVKSAPNGDIDLEDFADKARAAGDKLAAVMITYPSTHGVFEDTVREVCKITHDHGGQVYIDGANMNALVGLVKPGEIGGDVSHLNLHKTFAIPHGGGGPGMGPIGVKAHLAPYLPGDPQTGEGAVSAAQYGSASILLISWAYILMMGGEGLTQATRVAILNANYIASRLAGAYPILFMGNRGRVAHECILDTRPFAEHGVTVDDIAKRLVDNGFHAPTMSWPVSGTLMVEPTESETKAEIDRFITALLAIREEITDIAEERISVDQSPLHHAPHTVEDLVADWDRPYSREQGCFPAGAFRVDKYWPPVGRVDNAYGDRNLICTCPPLEAYAEAAE